MKVNKIKVPEMYFDNLTSDEVNVLDAIFVSDEMIQIRYENGYVAVKSAVLRWGFGDLRQQIQ